MGRLFLLIIILCSGLVVLISCAPKPSNDIIAPNQKATNGISLYEEYCASCHKPFAKTTKPQRRIGRLRSSIEHFPAMNNLDFLSDVQLEAIASALATISTEYASNKNKR